MSTVLRDMEGERRGFKLRRSGHDFMQSFRVDGNLMKRAPGFKYTTIASILMRYISLDSTMNTHEAAVKLKIRVFVDI